MEVISTAYEPGTVEPKWYRNWIRDKDFHAKIRSPKPGYAIVIPPPNVTDRLHMGHALNNSIQDVLIRYHRMLGTRTKWILGTDHATYWELAPGSIAKKYWFTDAGESFSAPLVETSRQSDDIFVHRLLGLWFLGFGTGDIEVRFNTAAMLGRIKRQVREQHG